MGVRVGGIKLHRSPELGFGAINPALSADDDAEIISRPRVARSLKNRLGQRGQRRIELFPVHVDDAQREPCGGIFQPDRDRLLEQFLRLVRIPR